MNHHRDEPRKRVLRNENKSNFFLMRWVACGVLHKSSQKKRRLPRQERWGNIFAIGEAPHRAEVGTGAQYPKKAMGRTRRERDRHIGDHRTPGVLGKREFLEEKAVTKPHRELDMEVRQSD